MSYYYNATHGKQNIMEKSESHSYYKEKDDTESHIGTIQNQDKNIEDKYYGEDNKPVEQSSSSNYIILAVIFGFLLKSL